MEPEALEVPAVLVVPEVLPVQSHLLPYPGGCLMQSYLPPEVAELTLEEPAAAAAMNRVHCPWATQEVVVVLVEVHGSVDSHLEKELAAAAAAGQPRLSGGGCGASNVIV